MEVTVGPQINGCQQLRVTSLTKFLPTLLARAIIALEGRPDVDWHSLTWSAKKGVP
jgi:hypothetical protein